MARKLKTYQTSLGFSDQAITAPSMKPALEVALDLGPSAYEVPLAHIQLSDIGHKARRHLRGLQLETTVTRYSLDELRQRYVIQGRPLEASLEEILRADTRPGARAILA